MAGNLARRGAAGGPQMNAEGPQIGCRWRRWRPSRSPGYGDAHRTTPRPEACPRRQGGRPVDQAVAPHQCVQPDTRPRTDAAEDERSGGGIRNCAKLVVRGARAAPHAAVAATAMIASSSRMVAGILRHGAQPVPAAGAGTARESCASGCRPAEVPPVLRRQSDARATHPSESSHRRHAVGREWEERSEERDRQQRERACDLTGREPLPVPGLRLAYAPLRMRPLPDHRARRQGTTTFSSFDATPAPRLFTACTRT